MIGNQFIKNLLNKKPIGRHFLIIPLILNFFKTPRIKFLLKKHWAPFPHCEKLNCLYSDNNTKNLAFLWHKGEMAPNDFVIKIKFQNFGKKLLMNKKCNYNQENDSIRLSIKID